jgi:asparagine synthase (glutamine-hydrolysing)
MCGIAGIIARESFDPQALVGMTHLISYRGPSGFGFAYANTGAEAPLEIIHNENRLPATSRPVIGLGNRRLAILDVSAAGNQPMEIADGSYSITYNGEIYNYREIRAELERCGHRFRTGTDTEVILRSYQEWGDQCLNRFNGMWSFALWDRAKQRLFCARDRFGVKPLYYAVYGNAFYFASEIKQILAASAMPRVANPQNVHHYLEWGLLDFSEETFFQGIRQLPGGHSLKLDLSQPLTPKVERYWELRVEPLPELSVEDAVEEFRARFENAVRLRLRSDVPVGVSLSGGLDSSAVLCQAKRVAPETQFETFSASFEEKAINEREYVAAAIASVAGIGHESYPQGPAFWKAIRSLIYHQDEPILSTGSFPQWCVMEDAKSHGVPVILGGQGGDETLCGYQKYRYFYFWELLRRGDPKIFREMMLWARNGTSFHVSVGSATKYLPGLLRGPFSLIERVSPSEFRNAFQQAPSGLGAQSSLAERQKTDLTYSSIPTLLHHEDRMSMAHSIESRLPFLDYKLVEFAVNCAPSLKLRDGWSKWILRNAMTGTLPEKIRLRKTKLGFDTPDREWVRMGLSNGQRALWDAPRLRMERFLDPRKVAQECQKFLRQAPTALSSDLIFRAVSLELWAQVHQAS